MADEELAEGPYVGVGYGGYGGYGPGPWAGPYAGGGTVIVTGRPPIAY